MGGFKGGTCLKKCYLETFRFSEDLDFTVLPGGPIEEVQVLSLLGQMLERIGVESGIDFTLREPRLRVRPNRSIEGRVYYRGPRNAPSPASVRLDLTRGEVVARPPVIRPIQHLYPDALPAPATVRCYSLEEVFAEKIRALGERGRPRDLYDVIFLLDHPALADHASLVWDVLVEKCGTKGVDVPTLSSVTSESGRAELESEWENMLVHQLPALPTLDHYWNRLPELFDWLEGVVQIAPPPAVGSPTETIWEPSATSWSWSTGPPLAPVRFAAANRLCVDLGYQGTVRRIEPLSLRVSSVGALLLYATKQATGEVRSYRVDRIQSIEATTVPFSSSRPVEFRPRGQLHAPPVARRSRGGGSSAPYRVECPQCGKVFRRKKLGTKLNPHKDPDGYPCRATSVEHHQSRTTMTTWRWRCQVSLSPFSSTR